MTDTPRPQPHPTPFLKLPLQTPEENKTQKLATRISTLRNAVSPRMAVPRAGPLSLAVPGPLLTQHRGQRDEGHRQLHTPHDVGDSPQEAVLVQQLLWLD